MQFLFFGPKTVQNCLKTAKVSLNICRPHAGRKLSQHKQPNFMRPARRSRNVGADTNDNKYNFLE